MSVITRVRIITPDTRIHVLDKTWSQLCELIRDFSPEQKDDFWNKKRVILEDGTDIVYVKEV